MNSTQLIDSPIIIVVFLVGLDGFHKQNENILIWIILSDRFARIYLLRELQPAFNKHMNALYFVFRFFV